MIVYAADKKQFLHQTDYDDIENVILENFKAATGRRVNDSEVRSWRESLSHVARVLRDESIPNEMGVAVELHIPQTSKRIDVTLTGRDANGKKNAIVIELKQWDKAGASEKDGIVVTFVGKGLREVVHPSYQAWSYAALLEGFNEAVYDGGISISPCAYLHNYSRDGIIDASRYSGYTLKAPLFLKGAKERERLRAFIKDHVKYGDSKEVLFELANGRIRPSKALADALKGLLAKQPEFVLIDDQKEVFEAILASARTASQNAPKVVVVEGGPGTGKTVLAINLLVRLIDAGLLGKYVSKNSAPRAVFQAKLVGTVTKTKFSNMFSGSGSFFNTDPDTYDFLLVDEAHRLNKKSGLYGTQGENQVKELIQASKCTIFFIDEDQRVTLDDIGTKQTIIDFATQKGAAVEEYELASQFRCNGSNGYLAWLDNVLEIRPTANQVLNITEYDFQVFDSPQALHQAIKDRNASNKARVVAGYCWPWLSKKSPRANDIEIGDHYRRQWNLSKDGSLWIIAPESIEQVGCIHTCQGLEVDYIGVIIGPDLIVRDGKVLTIPEARDRHDKSIRGYKTKFKTDPEHAKAEVDLIIKNTYRTLMTRGMKGCYVYCTDEETAAYFCASISKLPQKTEYPSFPGKLFSRGENT
jgi:DUF2075 family protein